jgi:hypothetical protein
MKCFGRGGQFALRQQQLAARLVCTLEFGKDGHCAFDSRARLIEALELYQRTRRQAQEVGILRVPAQRTGADGFRGFSLTGLQELLCLLKQFVCFYFMGNRSSPDFTRSVRYRIKTDARQKRRSRPVLFQGYPMSTGWHRTHLGSIAAGIVSRLPNVNRLAPDTPGIVASSRSNSAHISMPSRSGSDACSIRLMIDSGISAPLTLSRIQRAASADGNGDNAMMK